MNELSTQQMQLPDTLDDLSKFVLVGREKLNAVKAEIRAINKVGLAKEVHEQKLAEAQDIADAVLDAEVQIGKLTSQMDKASNQYASNSGVTTKKEQLEDLGLTKMQTSRYETLAKHPETVEQAKADARSEGRIVTRQDVLNRIVTPKTKKPSIKEVVEKAKQDHWDFQETKKESVVSIEDAIRDKENERIAIQDTRIRVGKVLQEVGTLSLISDEELREMAKDMSDLEKDSFSNNIREKIRILIHISNFLS